jgi:hypothetical protein
MSRSRIKRSVSGAAPSAFCASAKLPAKLMAGASKALRSAEASASRTIG